MVGSKKKSRDNPDQITNRKQYKTNDYWPDKLVPTYNSFEGHEEASQDVNNNTRADTVVKSSLIFIDK